MKNLILTLLVTVAVALQCADCPVNSPCTYSVPANCNTCYGITWCKEGKWYTDDLKNCTLEYCMEVIEIPNPYKGEK